MGIKRGKRIKLFKFEKLLYVVAICFMLLSPLGIVFSKATLSKLNIEVEQLKKEIGTQQKKNQSLTMKINELASLENIQTIAQNMGLKYNNDNIKIIVD
ncbi:MAG: cell division protein FtsL [Bacilli bacterium]|jgi:cell division protein FtsL